MAATVARERPTLETGRLILRCPRIEDFDAFAALMSDEESARFVGGVQSRPLAWRTFLQLAGAWELQGFSMFSVFLKTTGEWIGRVGPWVPEGWPGTEVGWGIVREHCRQGFATEAATVTMDWAFSELGWTEVIHTINPANAPSIAVATKLGARNRGPGQLPSPFEDVPVEIWGQTREDWMGRATPRS